MISMFRQDCARLSIFADLDDEQINHLSPYFEACKLPKDTVVFEQGQAAEYLYILISGEVIVRYKPYDGPVLTVARIEPDGVFGWSAALGREVYTSGAVAQQDSSAYRMRGAHLSTLCTLHPKTGKIFLERLAGVIAERLRGTHAQVLEILSQGNDPKNSQYKRKDQNDRK